MKRLALLLLLGGCCRPGLEPNDSAEPVDHQAVDQVVVIDQAGPVDAGGRDWQSIGPFDAPCIEGPPELCSEPYGADGCPPGFCRRRCDGGC